MPPRPPSRHPVARGGTPDPMVHRDERPARHVDGRDVTHMPSRARPGWPSRPVGRCRSVVAELT